MTKPLTQRRKKLQDNTPLPVSASQRPDESAKQKWRRYEPLEPRYFPNPPGFQSRFPPTTIDNVGHVLDAYGVSMSYDVIRKRLRHSFPGLSIAADNADNVALQEIISLCALNNLQSGLVPGYVDAIADRNRVNPIQVWIESKPWDQTDRLKEMQDTLTVREDFPVELRDLLMHRWFRSAAAAAIAPDFRCRGVLTLQGGQSLGKTTWVSALLPPEMRAEYLKIDHHLDPNSKDSVLTAVSHFIVEIGELDSSLKKDVARLKGFLTSPSDKVRRPYARSDSEYPRRTVFCATVNHANFLVDTTGNSRWWTLPVVAINYDHGIDMQQLFAQMAEEVKAGKPWWLTREEELLLDQQNADHLAVSVIRERLLAHVDRVNQDVGKLDYKMMKPIEVLEMLGFEHPRNVDMKECAEVLRGLFGDSKRSGGFNRWPVPVERLKPLAPRTTVAPSAAPDAPY